MAKTVQSTRSNTRKTRAKSTPNAPKVSALVHAVQPAKPAVESASAAQTAALAAVKLYVTAGKRESSARESATEAMATFIRTLHGDIAPKDIAQLLYGHGTTKSKKADETVYLRSVIIYNAYNKVHQKGVYEPAHEKEKRLAAKAAKKADKKMDEMETLYTDGDDLARLDDERLKDVFASLVRALDARDYNVAFLVQVALE